MDQPIVVGTGHAGVAAARKLVALGHRPLVLDAGITADEDRQQMVARLGAASPSSWDRDDVDFMTRNPTLALALPRKLSFGSDHVYAADHPAVPLERDDPDAPVPSLARGGFSNVWSGAMLPVVDADLAGWPIRNADLEPHYREVLAGMPLSARDDRLARRFPLYRDDPRPLTIAPQAAELLRRMEADPRLRDRDDVVFGQARLAVDAAPESSTGCRYCGRCQSGCAYGSIASTRPTLAGMEERGEIDLRSGMIVRSVEETADGVRVRCDELGGGPTTFTGSRIYVAAGAINSTRIVLESLQMWNRPIRLSSTQGFVAPLLQVGSPGAWPTSMTLASLMVEFAIPGSDHWVHAQIGPPNELAVAKLQLDGPRARHRFLRRASEHTMVAMCGFHSDHGGHHLLRLQRRGDGPHALQVETFDAPDFPPLARQASRRLRQLLAGSRVVVAPSVGRLISARPASWHVGATMPMRRDPVGPLDTDRLGRPAGWHRIHVVDSSVFTTVPGTTVALPAMANANRIVAESLAEDAVADR